MKYRPILAKCASSKHTFSLVVITGKARCVIHFDTINSKWLSEGMLQYCGRMRSWKLKNSRLRDLSLKFNYNDFDNFKSEIRAIFEEETLSNGDKNFLFALDFAYAKTFDETPSLITDDYDSDMLASGIYALSYFYARNSEDKIAYLVSRLGIDFVARVCSIDNSINLKLLHMMTSFEMGFASETLALFSELMDQERYVNQSQKFEYYNNLGLVSTQLQTDDDPWLLYEKAKSATASPVRQLMVKLNISDYLYLKKKYEEALKLLNETEDSCDLLSINSYKLILKLKILLQINDLISAGEIADELEGLIDSNEPWTDINVSYIFLGHFFVKIKSIEKAKYYLNLLKTLPEETLTNYIKGETLILESSLMHAKGDYFRALENSIAAFESLSIYSTVSPHLKDFVNNLFESITSIFGQLIFQLREKDDYTALHTLRVLKFCYGFGKELALEKIDLFNLAIGAMLHDYGKVDIPFEILNKPSSLTEEEFSIIKQHPIFGEAYLRDLKFPKAVRNIVKHHHERLDGTGYPDNLSGEEVHLLVQIAAIADVYDALTTNRPYRKALSRKTAIIYLQEKGDRIIEAGLLKKFISYVSVNEITVKCEELNSIWFTIISDLFRVSE